MVATFHTDARIQGAFAGGKEVLPGKIAGSVGVFKGEGMGEVNRSTAGVQVFFVQEADSLDLAFEVGDHRIRQGVTRSFSPFPSRTVIVL